MDRQRANSGETITRQVKVSVLGSDGNLMCQIPALRRGFEELGHVLTPYYWEPDVDFVFVGNPWFDQVIADKQAGRVKAKLIFNVLDIPPHISDFPSEKLARQLLVADAVTSISQWTHDILIDQTWTDSTIIYYPAKPVHYTGEKKHPFKVALVGRVNDPNKHVGMAISALIAAGYQENEVAIVGGEWPGWGSFVGMVSDDTLNDIYNSVDYVIMLSRYEGIGLPVYEGAVCGAIPIVHSHLSTRAELWDASPLGMTYQKIESAADVTQLLMSLNEHEERKQELKRAFREYAAVNLAPKFDAKEVAKRIIGVYERIKI